MKKHERNYSLEYLKPTNKSWICDIEGDLIPSTRVYCFCAINYITAEEVALTSYEDIKKWVNDRKEEGCDFTFHNGIGYDAPTMNRILGTNLTLAVIRDTMVLSMLFSPSIEGGHSLEAWGQRLRYPKGDFNDFSQFTPEMLEYCKQDVRLTRKVLQALIGKMNTIGFSEQGCNLEHRAWHLVKKQQENGFAFNFKEANILYAELRNFENEIRDDIYKYWPPELQIVNRYKQAKKKDGTYTANYLKHKDQYVRLEELNEGYVAWDYVAFNIGSPDQRRDKLLELGWKPLEFTKPSKTHPKGQAKLTDKGKLVPSLERFVEENDKEEVRLIAKWIDVNARGNMINTWMEAYNDKTGCIHGSLWFANTLRYRHAAPNTANIPAVRVDKEGHPLRRKLGVYTYEARDLWTVRRPDRRLVGVDAKGIQLRVLAHYLNNPAFTEAVLDGDPHSYNQEIGGFASRAISKTFIYAFLLGAGDAKVGQIVGGSSRDGRDLKARFIGNFPGLAQLLSDLERQVERSGRIRLIDGTPLAVDRMHTRLGYLLQGDESRIMKRAAINADLQCRKLRLDVLKVCDIHDEFQFDVYKDHVNAFKDDVLPYAFRTAGEQFNYRLPVDCDVKVGMTWSETH